MSAHSVARSSDCELEARHCPAAAAHQAAGTPRDKTAMMVGTCVHHMLEAVAIRAKGELPGDVIDRIAVELIGSGRSWEGEPPEFPTMETCNMARSLALDFLDRDEIRESAGWLRAELSVDLDGQFRRVDRDHSSAIWRQALDVTAIYKEETEDEREVTVVEVTDYKGGNASPTWDQSLQGMGAAVSAVAICPGADIVRRRIVPYLPWGVTKTWDLDLSDYDDIDKLEDYRRALLVASDGHRRRSGKTPDELAMPGIGCSAGYDGCPFLVHCKPAIKAAGTAAASWANKPRDIRSVANTWALATAIKNETSKIIKAALVDDVESIETPTGMVGWKTINRANVEPNASFRLARAWSDVILRLKPDSEYAQRFTSAIEGLLRTKGALGVATVKAICSKLGELLTKDERDLLQSQCLVSVPSRELSMWKGKKREPTDEELNNLLKRSIENAAKTPPRTSS